VIALEDSAEVDTEEFMGVKTSIGGEKPHQKEKRHEN
jgi:hypothetical protein